MGKIEIRHQLTFSAILQIYKTKRALYCQAQPKLQLSWAELALFSLQDDRPDPTQPDPNRNSFKSAIKAWFSY